VRYQYLTTALVEENHPVMLVGPVGTGKTSIAMNTLSKLDSKKYSLLTVNMSAQVGIKCNIVSNLLFFREMTDSQIISSHEVEELLCLTLFQSESDGLPPCNL
jgi:MoxR-like ATPase